MNIEIIRNEISSNINRSVVVKIYGMRNKTDTFKGVISNAYPNIFTVLVNGENKSFRYADILTKEVYVKYL